jgi:integrase/recombinase XerD
LSLSKKYRECTNNKIPIEIRKVINEYLLSLKLANKAEATISKYRWVIERFSTESEVSLAALSSEDVSKWLNEFSRGKKPRTVDLFLSALSSFFNFCLAEEYIETVLIKKRWRPKIPQSLPQYLNEQEFARTKLAAEGLSTRDRALVLFLFSSGCRRSEVVNLSI